MLIVMISSSMRLAQCNFHSFHIFFFFLRLVITLVFPSIRFYFAFGQIGEKKRMREQIQTQINIFLWLRMKERKKKNRFRLLNSNFIVGVTAKCLKLEYAEREKKKNRRNTSIANNIWWNDDRKMGNKRKESNMKRKKEMRVQEKNRSELIHTNTHTNIQKGNMIRCFDKTHVPWRIASNEKCKAKTVFAWENKHRQMVWKTHTQTHEHSQMGLRMEV